MFKGNEVCVSDDVKIVYKKVRLMKDGSLRPLFIDKRSEFRIGEWTRAGFHPTNGFAPRSLGTDENTGKQIGAFHCCFKPLAPHLADELKSGETRVWVECQARGKNATYDRPESQGGTWCLYEWIKPLRVLRSDEVEVLVAG